MEKTKYEIFQQECWKLVKTMPRGKEFQKARDSLYEKIMGKKHEGYYDESCSHDSLDS